MPDSLLRLMVFFLVHTVYRMRVRGRDNIPAKGGALFVCNHLSLVDALLLGGSTERHIRFLMFKGYYDHPIIGLFARAARAIPISSEQRPREMIRSLRAASEAIRNGEVVCIFAEGQMTRIGQMLPFRRGFERIMKGVVCGIPSPLVMGRHCRARPRPSTCDRPCRNCSPKRTANMENS
jgi:acyl-[acyl-carrier-protein]-phospholipid O-acyltransferase/long-chain-fatty-acid--[acyl-carrier-protein] ligase